MFIRPRHVLVICLVLLLPSMTAFAGAPNRTHIHVQVEGGDFWVCDSDESGGVTEGDTQLEGRFWFNINEFSDYDGAGNLLRTTWTQSFHGLITNVDTGAAVVRDRFEGRDSFDETTGIYTQSGATRHMFLPGEGTLYHSAGRISINVNTGEVLWQRGPHPLGPSSFCELVEGAGEEIAWVPQASTVTVLGPR